MSGEENKASKGPIKQGEIEREMDIQENLLDSLNKQISVLEEKLLPILREQNSPDKGLGNESNLCLLANRIKNKNTRISVLIDVLADVNDRIEL